MQIEYTDLPHFTTCILAYLVGTITKGGFTEETAFRCGQEFIPKLQVMGDELVTCTKQTVFGFFNSQTDI